MRKSDKSRTRQEQAKRAFQSMRHMMLLFRARMDEAMRPLDITLAQAQVLFAIREHPRSSGAQIARYCFITPQTAQTLLRHLEKRRWSARGKDSENDRIVVAWLTKQGEELASAVKQMSLPLQEELWSNISANELTQLNELLSRCLKNMDPAATD
jgi:DNA-binding MarR family transcriptional regulator